MRFDWLESMRSVRSDFRAGDWVEVKSADEILATLDDQASVEGLPFMQEMLQYCGRRFQVYRSAHKTCDTITTGVSRSVSNAVHLTGLRCDGSAHGGCQAACLFFWKEVWLKPVFGPEATTAATPAEVSQVALAARAGCGAVPLKRATQAANSTGSEERYRCQATDLLKASSPLHWGDPRQYINDVVSRNVRLRDLILYGLLAAYNAVMRLHWRLRFYLYPRVRGLARGTTPTMELNLQPGELVEVRSWEEIMRTINEHNRNRGLSFDVEMVPFCGRKFRVRSRVEKIINERTGKMIRIPTTCVILEGVTCGGCLSRKRLFCPRSIYPYWHEIWLKRVECQRVGTPASQSC
ncbi:MAG: hypothetical protein MN733_02720 [Nitrososphaera sp.]|nr:hypothetical protein [Nitrososphaera sp.]